MINKKKVVAVLPAYNAEKMLQRTVQEIPNAVDTCILVDDHSADATAELAHRPGLRVHAHDRNRGYGGHQKTCYSAALDAGADVVVMLHPDYHYSPLLVEPMASMIAFGSSINRGMINGFGVLKTTADYVAACLGLYREAIFDSPPMQLKQRTLPVSTNLKEVR